MEDGVSGPHQLVGPPAKPDRYLAIPWALGRNTVEWLKDMINDTLTGSGSMTFHPGMVVIAK